MVELYQYGGKTSLKRIPKATLYLAPCCRQATNRESYYSVPFENSIGYNCYADIIIVLSSSFLKGQPHSSTDSYVWDYNEFFHINMRWKFNFFPSTFHICPVSKIFKKKKGGSRPFPFQSTIGNITFPAF